jgi:hypothetical protein
MYIFAKFVSNHIFLQNRDKLNIKKFKEEGTAQTKEVHSKQLRTGPKKTLYWLDGI